MFWSFILIAVFHLTKFSIFVAFSLNAECHLQPDAQDILEPIISSQCIVYVKYC
jgi:hypothetical protein